MPSKNRSTRFPYLLLLPAALFFVLPIPHTIALRDSLALLCVGLFIYFAYRDGRPQLPVGTRLPIRLYLAFLIWLAGAGAVLAKQPAVILHEIASQWLRGLIYLGIGALVALKLYAPQRRMWLGVLVAVLLIHVAYADLAALAHWLWYGEWVDRVNGAVITGLTAGPDRLSLLVNMLLAMLLVEALRRACGEEGMFPVRTRVLAAAFAVPILGFFVASTRNGMVALVVFAVLFAVLLMRGRRLERAPMLALLGGLALVVALGAWHSWRTDPRWDSLRETIPLALDTEGNKAWLVWEKYPPPRLASGETVAHSNYTRIAWLKEGMLLVKEHPFGIGFERGAFGRGLQAKYGEGLGQHSHSGMLDLAIGAGIPGVLLWVAFLAVLWWQGYKAWITRRDYSGALLVFVVSDFFTRSLVDSIVRDYMLLQFLFLVGTLFVVMTRAEGLHDAHRA